MAYKEVFLVDVREIIRRWQDGQSQRKIARETAHSRNTVSGYVAAARDKGLTRDGPEPTEGQLAELAARNLPGPRDDPDTPAADLLAPHRDWIRQMLDEEDLQLTRVHELLEKNKVVCTYSTLRRFCLKEGLLQGKVRDTVRMVQTGPGEVMELDFGRMGKIWDPDKGCARDVWTMQTVCAFSRHMFVWPLHRQKIEDVIEGLDNTFEFFGGVPRFLVIDNFPAAVARAHPRNPVLTRSFTEYCQHRGFFADPCCSASPTQKPKTERSIQYARERFFKGERFASLADMRARARQWCLEVAGRRNHGTIRRRPLEVFEQKEREHLRPYDGIPFDIGHWQSAKVQRGHHVQAQHGIYSVPYDACRVGDMVEIRLTRTLARIYRRSQLIKVHPRQEEGGRITDPLDVAPEKRDYLSRDPEPLQRQAAEMGDQVAFYAAALLGSHPTTARLRSTRSLIRLGERFGQEALGDACRRAIEAELYDVDRLKTMLLQGLERDNADDPPPPPPSGQFARDGDEFTARPLIEDDRDHYQRGA